MVNVKKNDSPINDKQQIYDMKNEQLTDGC